MNADLNRAFFTPLPTTPFPPGCPKMLPGLNPATWMLEVTGGARSVTVKAVDMDWPARY